MTKFQKELVDIEEIIEKLSDKMERLQDLQTTLADIANDDDRDLTKEELEKYHKTEAAIQALDECIYTLNDVDTDIAELLAER